jgi:ABC-type multidrug transport system ATPase subunit
MADHVPASLDFSDVSYTLGSHTILSISGSVKPGQVMAIIGASGAGKSTFLYILARKRKKSSMVRLLSTAVRLAIQSSRKSLDSWIRKIP